MEAQYTKMKRHTAMRSVLMRYAALSDLQKYREFGSKDSIVRPNPVEPTVLVKASAYPGVLGACSNLDASMPKNWLKGGLSKYVAFFVFINSWALATSKAMPIF